MLNRSRIRIKWKLNLDSEVCFPHVGDGVTAFRVKLKWI